jgi:hypothetical protein
MCFSHSKLSGKFYRKGAETQKYEYLVPVNNSMLIVLLHCSANTRIYRGEQVPTMPLPFPLTPQ